MLVYTEVASSLIQIPTRVNWNLHFGNMVRKFCPELVDRSVKLLECVAFNLIVRLVEQAYETGSGN